jgi:hypothetical protein
MNPFHFSFRLIIFVAWMFISIRCETDQNKASSPNTKSVVENQNWCEEGITDLKPGDILVKPNINMLPGSSNKSNGWTFGHAAMVVKGYAHKNIDTLLANVTIIESIARDVPQAYQVREIAGYVENKNLALCCTSFGPKFKGNRYRLRLNLSAGQIDSIIAFARDQKNKPSCWNAMKSFPDDVEPEGSTRKNWADNSQWYCSLLVWQSYYYVTGIDLDANGGYEVYPNDLIASKYFDIGDDHFPSRARF